MAFDKEALKNILKKIIGCKKLSKGVLICNICFSFHYHFSIAKETVLGFYHKPVGLSVVNLCSNLISLLKKKYGMGKNC